MRQIFKNHIFVAILAYFFIIGLTTIALVGFFQKIKLANDRSREQLSVYQNLKIKEGKFIGNLQKVTCDGNLFFKAGAPVAAIHINRDRLYLSQIDNKLVVINLVVPEHPAIFTAPVLTDIYSDATDVYGTDFFGDRVVRLIFEKGEVVVENVYPKIGRASALTRDLKGYYYVSGYASGNITKIIGRDGFLFLSGLDKTVDLESSGSSNLLVARYGAKPTLISIDLVEKQQTVIEGEKNISSLFSDGVSFWATYDNAGQSYLGKIVNERLVDQVLNCPFPLKIAVFKDRFFYTSLNDSEGKIYWINKNLQRSGK